MRAGCWKGECVMRFKIVALGFLVIALLGAMTGVGYAERQTPPVEVIFSPASTPINTVDCGGGIEIFSENGIVMPAGVTNVFACATYIEPMLSGSTITAIDPNILISNDSGNEPAGKIRQKGTAYLTILQGELTVVIFSKCAKTQDCSDVEEGSKAELSFVGADNAVTTIVLDSENQNLPDPVTRDSDGRPTVKLTKGQSLVLNNVTVSYLSGNDGALVAASGSYDLTAGEGCVVRCWQFT